VVDKQVVPAELTGSDRKLSQEIDRMDGAELWRACFLGGMEESRYRGMEASIKSIRMEGDDFRSIAQ
jgi:hypothetical protein